MDALISLIHACPGTLLVYYRNMREGMLFNGWHNCRALSVSGEGGHVSLQAQVPDFVLCRLVSWMQLHPEWDRL